MFAALNLVHWFEVRALVQGKPYLPCPLQAQPDAQLQ